MHVYEVRPRKDKRGVDLVSDALPFGRLWYAEPNAVSNAIDYAKFRSRLILVDHHTVDHAGFAGAVIIDINASAKPLAAMPRFLSRAATAEVMSASDCAKGFADQKVGVSECAKNPKMTSTTTKPDADLLFGMKWTKSCSFRTVPRERITAHTGNHPLAQKL
jgi:hypothetical protein